MRYTLKKEDTEQPKLVELVRDPDGSMYVYVGEYLVVTLMVDGTIRLAPNAEGSGMRTDDEGRVLIWNA